MRRGPRRRYIRLIGEVTLKDTPVSESGRGTLVRPVGGTVGGIRDHQIAGEAIAHLLAHVRNKQE